ncbi:uncharacterized protein [Euphorbia lathyris]|uniref:uncharacterized protein n=1 Tax=Euphorbia lathyris TaxID=212925 RepID=UPI00331433DA
MEDDMRFESLPPLKRLRVLQERHLHDNKENCNPSFRLPAKKRKESRPPPLHSSDYTPFPLPAKKRVSALNPDFLSPFDLNIEYKPPPSFAEIPQPEKEEEEEDDDGIVCSICESTDGDPTDPIVLCDGCDLMVHTSCYGNPLIMGVPEGEWFCAQCLSGKGFSCCLCPKKSGAMKPTKDGLWAHIVCSVYVPEVFFEDPDGREGIDCSKIPKRRWQDKCYICNTRKGCAIRCSEPMCTLPFHVTCALNQHLCIEYKQQGNQIIVAGFCNTHSQLWKKQQETGKFKIVATKHHNN